MTGNIHEVNDAVREGVHFAHLLQAVKIGEDYIQCVEVTPLESEAGVTYEEDFTRLVKIHADMVIIAIGQGPQGGGIGKHGEKNCERSS